LPVEDQQGFTDILAIDQLRSLQPGLGSRTGGRAESFMVSLIVMVWRRGG
jgi:hypothetical protein